MTYAAKIEGTNVKIVEIRTNSTKRTFGCAGYRGAKSVNITGDLAAVTCGDGKVRVYDIRTGSLKRTL
ncbi:MAG: hypothetical protein O9331_06195 [Acidovorax sp.]|nr:hypothetical protein [Acidovorax sp.]